MVQEFINKHFLYLLVFTLTFGILLYDLIGFDYTDEFCALFLFFLFGYYVFNTPDWRIEKSFLITLAIFFFYLCYSFWIGSNVKAAILTDFLIQIKPYLAFFCVFSITPVLSANQKVALKLVALLFWVFLLLVGIIELFHEGTMRLIMGHQAYYAAAVVSVSLCYLLCTNFTLKDKLIFLLLLSIGIISGRSKFFGFYAFAVVLILYFSNTKHFKLNVQTIVVGIFLLAAMIFVAWSKIQLYFIQNLTVEPEERDLIARFVLYATSIQIFQDYFPFGSGFGSFATFSSGLYYSDIYAQYGVENVWGMNKQSYPYIADTYYPSLAQFGVVGLLLYIGFWLFIVGRAYTYFKANNQLLMYLMMAILVTIYFAIEGTSDSTFTTHRGFFILMLLGMCLAYMRKMASPQHTEVTTTQHSDESTAN